MTGDRYTDRLSALVDGALPEAERAEVERHVAGCAECRVIERDLRHIRDAAATLGRERREPSAALWPRLSARLADERRSAGGLAPGRPVADAPGEAPPWRWLAAAATVVVAAGLATWLWSGPPEPTDVAVDRSIGSPAAAVATIEAELEAAESHYMNAIAGLEEIARGVENPLDPEIAIALRRNMEVLDGAIAESRAALQAEPESPSARNSLFEALRRKVDLLQDTIALMNEMRKGDAAEAGRIVGQLGEP